MKGVRRYVLDACALLRLAQDEAGADRVAEIMQEASSGQCHLLLHVINFGEVVYRVGKVFGWETAERKRGEMALLPMRVVEFDEDTFWQAVRLKAEHPLSYADCFAAALAPREGAAAECAEGRPQPSNVSC